MVNATHGLVVGASVVFWAFATWLIPVLVAMILVRTVLLPQSTVLTSPSWR